MLQFIVILLLVLPVASASAAENTYNPGSTLERFRTHLVLHPDGTYIETREQTWRVDTRQGVELASTDAVYYVSSMDNVEQIKGWSTTPDGVRHDVEPSMIRTQEELAKEGDAEFSDLKSKTIIYPSVQVGSRVSHMVRINHHETIFPGHFGAQYFPTEAFKVEDWQLDVDVPTGMKFALEVHAIEGGLIGSSKGLDHYRFRYTNSVALQSEDDTVTQARNRPHVAMSTYADPVAVGRAYQSASRPMAVVTPAIRKRAQEVTAGLESTADKARALQYWVARNIRYVYVGLGESRLVPHKADSVLSKLYGDCKDHSILLEAMLSAVGIASSHALINLGSSYELSSIGVLGPMNHVMTYVPELDLYLDSTDGFASFGQLSRSTMDKPTVLTALGKIGHTPRMLAAQHVSLSEQEIMISSDGQMVGQGMRRLSGHYESYGRSERFDLRGVDEAKYIKEWLSGFSESGVGHMDSPDPEKLGEPFWVKSEFALEPLSNFPGPGALAVPVGLTSGTLAIMASDQPPTERRREWACVSRTMEERSVLHFPIGTEITFVPQGALFEERGYRYESRYERQGLDVTVTRRFVEQHEGGVCGKADHEARLSFHAALRKDLRGQVIYR